MKKGYRVDKLKIVSNLLEPEDSEKMLFPMFFDKLIKIEAFAWSDDKGKEKKRGRIIIVPKFNHNIQIETIVRGVDYYFVDKKIVHSDNIGFEGRLDVIKTYNEIYVFEYGCDIFQFTAKGAFINEAKYIEPESTEEPA